MDVAKKKITVENALKSSFLICPNKTRISFIRLQRVSENVIRKVDEWMSAPNIFRRIDHFTIGNWPLCIVSRLIEFEFPSDRRTMHSSFWYWSRNFSVSNSAEYHLSSIHTAAALLCLCSYLICENKSFRNVPHEHEHSLQKYIEQNDSN